MELSEPACCVVRLSLLRLKPTRGHVKSEGVDYSACGRGKVRLRCNLAESRLVACCSSCLRCWLSYCYPNRSHGCIRCMLTGGARCLQWLGGLTVLLPGVVLQVRAISVLNHGVRLERWREEEVDALRVTVEKPLWSASTWALTVMLALLVFLLPRHSSFSSAWCFIWMPLTLLSALRNAVRKPDSAVPSILSGFPSQSLHSEHRGQRIS